MKAYKPSSATYKDSIPIVETTDTNHADNVNQAPKQLIENDMIVWRGEVNRQLPTLWAEIWMESENRLAIWQSLE